MRGQASRRGRYRRRRARARSPRPRRRPSRRPTSSWSGSRRETPAPSPPAIPRRAGRYRRSRRSRRRCRPRARSRSARPATAACAGSDRRPAHCAAAPQAAEADVPPRRRVFRRRRYRAYISPRRTIAQSTRARCFVARQRADSLCARRIGGLRDCRLVFTSPRLRGEVGLRSDPGEGILRESDDRECPSPQPSPRKRGEGVRALRYPIDQTNGALPPAAGFMRTRNVAAAAGGETLEQSFQHLCAGRVIIADIGHQLPALLADLELALGDADLGGIVLRIEQRAQEGSRNLLPARARSPPSACATSSKYCMPISFPVRCRR